MNKGITKPSLPTDSANPRLVVDGIGEDGLFAGDGKHMPFVVFDTHQQKIVAGPYDSHHEAVAAMGKILLGAPALLDEVKLDAQLEAIDSAIA
ncbi:hypothetical protein [Herbaspirillum huttiense]|uniref:hypothetical protein n=1 Tax=Herbaspirillum huttiense TaxID=863372 RepID=UPI0039AF4DE8